MLIKNMFLAKGRKAQRALSGNDHVGGYNLTKPQRALSDNDHVGGQEDHVGTQELGFVTVLAAFRCLVSYDGRTVRVLAAAPT